MIELKDISVTFQSDQNKDIRAVQNVDLQVAPGDVYGIVGYSGAGKSTLVRTINLLQPPTSGQVIVHDQVLTNMSEEKLREARKKIGMIFQHFNLMDSRTIFDNVAFPLKRSQLSRIEINQKVAELLELVGLEDKAFSYPSQLSGGQKQRVAIARSLANDPEILLCDEATSALDNESEHYIQQALDNVMKDRTTIVIAHRLTTIESADRIAVLDGGQLLEIGTHNELMAANGHYSQMYARNFDLPDEGITPR